MLWEKSPTEIVAHFGYLEDAEDQYDHAIAVLIHRGEDPSWISRVLHVGTARVEKVLRGDGVDNSILQFVRSQMGPRPDHWAAPQAAEASARATAAINAEGKHPPTPQERDSVRSVVFLRLGEGASVRKISQEIGKSVGYVQKLRAEWSAQAGTQTGPEA